MHTTTHLTKASQILVDLIHTCLYEIEDAKNLALPLSVSGLTHVQQNKGLKMPYAEVERRYCMYRIPREFMEEKDCSGQVSKYTMSGVYSTVVYEHATVPTAGKNPSYYVFCQIHGEAGANKLVFWVQGRLQLSLKAVSHVEHRGGRRGGVDLSSHSHQPTAVASKVGPRS